MRHIDEQLTKYLTDAHSMEEQALAQLERAPSLAGDPELASAFQEHLLETQQQMHLVKDRLAARGAERSKVKDAVMRAGGLGFLLFAKLQPDTPGKLTAHAYSYEHLEVGAYELLGRVAQRAGDEPTAEAAALIRAQERAMADRLESLFDRAAELSLRDVSADDAREQLPKYLADAHAIEAQAISLLEKSSRIAGDPHLAALYEEHLGETRDQQRMLEERLDALGGSRNALKDAALRLGALSWGAFFAAQRDTPGKLAAFGYAFEHLEIAGYEQLQRVARRAGDDETIATAERILEQERNAASKIADEWDRAVDASLDAVGVAR